MNRSDIYPGMIVEVNAGAYRGRAWKVTKINPKNIKLVDSTGVGLNASPNYLSPTELTFTEDDEPRLVLGQVVKYKGEDYVIIKSGFDTYNIAKLGGDNDRYYRSVPAARLTVKVTA